MNRQIRVGPGTWFRLPAVGFLPQWVSALPAGLCDNVA